MILFYLTEAFRIFKRSPFTTIVVISITTIAILLSSFSFYLVFISQQLSLRVKKNIEIVAYLHETIDSTQTEKVKGEISSLNFVASVKFVSKEEALKDFVLDTGEDFSAMLESNPLPQSFVIKLRPDYLNKENLDPEVQAIKNIPGISDVDYENEFVIRLLRYLKSGQLIVYSVSAALILLSIYLVYVYSKLQFRASENLYRTMKLVGAKLRTLKLPILIYGFLIGAISGLLSLGFNLLIIMLIKYFIKNLDFPLVLNGIFVISIGLGIILGLLGSYLSAKKINIFIGDKI